METVAFDYRSQLENVHLMLEVEKCSGGALASKRMKKRNALRTRDEYLDTKRTNGPSPLIGLEKDVTGFRVGDSVLISGQQCGKIRFLGETHFQTGVWAGVDLVNPVGLHNGTVDGLEYFSCRPHHGVFAPLCKLEKIQSEDTEPKTSKSSKR